MKAVFCVIVVIVISEGPLLIIFIHHKHDTSKNNKYN